MKKTYKNPELAVVKIQTHHQMLAGSFTKYEEEVDEGLARDFDWDEEEY